MAGNLRDRLRRIQDNKKAAVQEAVTKNCSKATPAQKFFGGNLQLKFPGWETAGFGIVRREIIVPAPDVFAQLSGISSALAILIPDLNHIAKTKGHLPEITDILFFDLETTGLSGGAGTVAFLAAFGRFVHTGAALSLRITQYLLLDYPGENDFLEALLGEFKNKQQVITSYNGKCFDSQILKTRCLMNGIKPPEYFHADLLYPARRLWKRILANCSQGTIETEVLGLDRTGDTPGFMAPEIWFDFLKTGNEEPLMGICDHNCRDITGLASIFAGLADIACNPISALEKYRCDLEQLALHWRDFIHREKNNPFYAADMITLEKTKDFFMNLAANEKYPRAAFVYALDQLRYGDHDEGRKRLLTIAASDLPLTMLAAAFRALAIDSERRLADVFQAVEFAKKGLQLQEGGSWQREFEHRVQRLEGKLEKNCSLC